MGNFDAIDLHRFPGLGKSYMHKKTNVKVF